MADLDVGALPICGEEDRLKRMLTDRDIVVRALAIGRNVHEVTGRTTGRGQACHDRGR
jgi:hypothetical protein